MRVITQEEEGLIKNNTEKNAFAFFLFTLINSGTEIILSKKYTICLHNNLLTQKIEYLFSIVFLTYAETIYPLQILTSGSLPCVDLLLRC